MKCSNVVCVLCPPVPPSIHPSLHLVDSFRNLCKFLVSAYSPPPTHFAVDASSSAHVHRRMTPRPRSKSAGAMSHLSTKPSSKCTPPENFLDTGGSCFECNTYSGHPYISLWARPSHVPGSIQTHIDGTVINMNSAVSSSVASSTSTCVTTVWINTSTCSSIQTWYVLTTEI